MTQAQTQKIEYAYFERWEKCLCVVQNASFMMFLHIKMVAYEVGYKGSSENSYPYVFLMLYHFAIILKQL